MNDCLRVIISNTCWCEQVVRGIGVCVIVHVFLKFQFQAYNRESSTSWMFILWPVRGQDTTIFKSTT